MTTRLPISEPGRMQCLPRKVQPLSEYPRQQDGQGRGRKYRGDCVGKPALPRGVFQPVFQPLSAHARDFGRYRGLPFGPTPRLSCTSPYGLLGCRSAGLKLVGQAGRAGGRSRRSCGIRFSRSCRDVGPNLAPAAVQPWLTAATYRLGLSVRVRDQEPLKFRGGSVVRSSGATRV